MDGLQRTNECGLAMTLWCGIEGGGGVGEDMQEHKI